MLPGIILVLFCIVDQVYPKPIISVSPRGILALGGSASIHCNSENNPHTDFYLYRQGDSLLQKAENIKSSEAVFRFANAQPSDGGIYWCTYCSDQNSYKQCSNFSDYICINVTGECTIFTNGTATGVFIFWIHTRNGNAAGTRFYIFTLNGDSLPHCVHSYIITLCQTKRCFFCDWLRQDNLNKITDSMGDSIGISWPTLDPNYERDGVL